MWEVRSVAAFEAWFLTLDGRVRVEIAARIDLLGRVGPTLGRPHVDTLTGSAFPNMKELRIQIDGEPWRVFFAFDPQRAGVLLVGGNKAGDGRFYDVNIPVADARYREHLAGLPSVPSKKGPKR
ncbi:MAG: type II toxin-antitoxin system RelE/ParE family toxin [Beijerinckiaceae bacterium]